MPSLVNDTGLFTMSEFRSRGTIKLSPDVLVYINGHLGSRVISPKCDNVNGIDFNDGITSLNVQNTMTNPGQSTASIEITTPIYGENSNYWTEFTVEDKKYKVPFLVPMMEVRIYAKGRYLVNFEPKYYPIFWGFIVSVSEAYVGNSWKITLNCADMLHWWEYSQVNVHPSVETLAAFGGEGNSQRATIYTYIFEEANPFTIIWQLVNDAFVTKKDKAEDAFQRFITPTHLTQETNLNYTYPPDLTKHVARGLMNYWKQRFRSFGGMLKMYGASGEISKGFNDSGELEWVKPNELPIDDPSLSSKKRASWNRISEEFNVTDHLEKFTTFFEFNKMQGLSEATYKSKLEIATETKNRAEYEFFQDVDGTLVFKPPFYNLDTSTIEPYVIRPYDILSSSFDINSDAIVTVLEVLTPLTGQYRTRENPLTIGFHVDIDLAAKYGLRHKSQIVQYIPSTDKSKVANQLALGHMGLINAKATTGTITIPGRPEMKLGYPIYIDHRDSYHYVTSINHTFDYGGSFTTVLSLEGERRRQFDYVDNKWKGPIKNKVYKFVKDLEPELQRELMKTEMDVKDEKLLYSTKRASSIAQGRYEIADIKDAAKEFGYSVKDCMTVTDKTVPFTDSKGYKLIGSFMYGRNIKVDGKTRMTPEEMQKSTTTTGEDLEKKLNRDKITVMHPSYYGESMKMKTFFDEVAEEDGIIPKYNDFDNLKISLDDKSKDENGISRTAREITLASVGERRCKEGPTAKNMSLTLEKIQKLKKTELSDPRLSPHISTKTFKAIQNRLEKYEGFIKRYSDKYKVEPDLVKAIIAQESSGYNDVTSKKDAKGLMQLIDSTARDMGVTDSFDPAQNIKGGTRYISEMLKRYDNDLIKALAAYNAGPDNVDYYDGVPPYVETQDYVQKVLGYYNRFKSEPEESESE